jgi:DNA-binding transcriptional MerR regulator
MELVKITDLTNELGITSRTLRYYEQVGLISSVRPDKFRFYDNQNIERLRQIIVLRKMQIPVKDIIRIYENEDMETVVEVFCERIREIEEQENTLFELKRITSEFLKTMTEKGIKKISALPLLYEEMDKKLTVPPVTLNDINAVSRKISAKIETSIIDLPQMRLITSVKNGVSDIIGFYRFTEQNGITASGQHERFEYQTEKGDIVAVRVKDDFCNNGGFEEENFTGGLFAVSNVYLDDDLGERLRSVITSFDNNDFYEIDYTNKVMLENLISPDERRELVALLVPVKQRLANPDLFDKPREVTGLTAAEIEAAEQVLWEKEVNPDNITPINSPHFKVLQTSEIEYNGYISTRVLNTNVSVKLPFRVDFEYRADISSARFGYGASEGDMCVYHGTDLAFPFGVNTDNHPDDMRRSLVFYGPLYKDKYEFPGRGGIENNRYNRVTWIVGARNFAVIINGEVRFCGENFPYMKADLSRTEALSVVIGGDGQSMKYLKNIRISALVQPPKSKKKKEELIMNTKQSNNTIPIIRRLITSEYGENYWFNGCAGYVMECLGETEYDYMFFAGLTGDVIAQFYPTDGRYRGDGISSISMFYGDGKWVKNLFAKCGYESSYVKFGQIADNKEIYRQALIGYIDKGIPVIRWKSDYMGNGVLVGYEDYGKTLLYITGNDAEPKRLTFEEAISPTDDDADDGWIFVGDKKEQPNTAEIYREVIRNLPALFESNVYEYVLGARAFCAWADAVESGAFDNLKPEGFDSWGTYTAYVCALSTNASCSWGFFDKVTAACPEMTFTEDVKAVYQRMAAMWNNDNGSDLEALGGGFNVSLETLQDKQKRAKIAAKLREFAECADEIVRLIKSYINN